MNPKGIRAWLAVLAATWLVVVIAAILASGVLARGAGVPAYYSQAQARDGLIAYSQHCASCHGPNLLGVSAPALVGERFWASWEGDSVLELYAYIHDKMPYGQGGTLADETYAASTAYILERNGFPEGERLEPGDARLAELELRQELADPNLEAPYPLAEPAQVVDFFGYAERRAALLQSGASLAARGALPVFLAQAPEAPEQASAQDSVQDSSDGEAVYRQHCASCHGNAGGGGVGPALAENPALDDGAYVVEQILHGGGGMPPFEDQLSSAQIASVATYIRSSWGNDYGAVSAQEVEESSSQPGETESEESSAEQDAQSGEAQEDEQTQAQQEQSATEQEAEPQPAQEPDDQTQSPEEAQPAEGEAPAQASEQPAEAGQAADLRLTVLPEDAEVVLRGPDGFEQALPGGSRVVAGLAPGVYTLSATFDGETLERETELVGGEVAELELVFSEGQSSPAGEEEANLGQHVYDAHCAACHGPAGAGGIGLPLASNPRLANAPWTVRRVLIGANAMPPFGARLSAEEVAAVSSFVRSSWGNDYEPVSAEAVLEVAGGIPAGELTGAVEGLEDATLGVQRYTQLCAACHGLQGGGDVGPPLAGNPNLRNLQLVVPTVLHGRGLMPAFSLHSDLELAEIISHIRTSWSNDYGPVSPAEVQAYRPEAGRAQEGVENDANP